MSSSKFKAAVKRAMYKHIPAHIVDQVEFTEFREWRDYKRIQIGLIGKHPQEDAEYPISLGFLNELAKLFDSTDIKIRGGCKDTNQRRMSDRGITIFINHANFGKVLRGKIDPYIKEKDRFELIDESED